MTIAVPLRTTRSVRLIRIIGLARATCFAVAVGLFLSAPPVLPWVLAVVAATNVVHLVARASITQVRLPLTLLVANGATVMLVVALVFTI